MRLLKTSNFELKHYTDDRKLPEYAILSHTWEDGQEVLFADIGTAAAVGKSGYRKLQYSCKQAQADSLEYIWIDTCCIDKSSSAELSEAINSMYSWYKNAKICYAFLADFPLRISTLTESKWFTRGWTLQELIAPHAIVFYSGDWVELGTKWTLRNDLAKRTGIDIAILSGVNALASASVARRMSWAWNRETTRTEDEAYCLMGLFDVNMPMLYGEGSKAFLRLQEEIMKHSDDQSLFAWTDSAADPDTYKGLLASSPKYFEKSGDIIPYRDWDRSDPFSISNKGLRIDIPLTRWKDDVYVAALDCPAPPNLEGFLGIYLKKVANDDRQFARVKSHSVCRLNGKGSSTTIYVRQSHVAMGAHDIYPLHVFQLRQGPSMSAEFGYQAIKAAGSFKNTDQVPHLAKFSPKAWSKEIQSTFKISPAAGRLAGAVLFERHDGEKLVVLLGSLADFIVGFDAVVLSNVDDISVLREIFNPQAEGTNMVLEDHQVRVTTEQRVLGGVKYYMVDIVIEAIYHSFNPVDMLLDRVSALQNEPDQRPHTARLDPPRGLRKQLRSALKFS